MASVPIQQVAIISLLSQFNTIINRTFIFISLCLFGSCHLVDTDETTPYHFVPNNHGFVRFSIGYGCKKYAKGCKWISHRRLPFAAFLGCFCKNYLVLPLLLTSVLLMKVFRESIVVRTLQDLVECDMNNLFHVDPLLYRIVVARKGKNTE